MHRTPSPVVSTGSRALRHRSPARGVGHRRPLEALEGRVLFAAGDFDTTFGGGDGAALVDFGGTSDFASSIVPLADGKILVGGSVGNGSNTDDVFGIARLNADGSLDTTFGGGDGLATLDLGPDADLNNLTVGPDGKIVAVGRVDSPTTVWDWAVARFNADGTPDTTFGGGDGWLTQDFFGFGDTAWGVAVEPDNQIVVTGVATGSTAEIAVVRYNVDGSVDTTFDGDGRNIINVFGGADFGSETKIQSDGKIIIVGGSVQPGSYRRFVLVRLDTDGTLDTSFDSDGIATADFGAKAWGKDVEIQSDGKYVVGGFLDTQPLGEDQLDFAVARFEANGRLDTSFGTNGRTVFTGTGGDELNLYGLEIQQNGKILLGGTTKNATGTFAGVARLNANGTPDATFGTGGIRQFTIPGTTAGTTRIQDLELAADGGILMGGYPLGAPGGIDFAVVKLQNDDGPPPLPGSISGVVFNDANQNGVRDPGETGLSGWTVYQDINNNGQLDSGPVIVNANDPALPREIPEFPGGPFTVVSTFDVSGVGTSIVDLDVRLDITHTWDADLTVTLVSPSGQEVLLFSEVGGPGDNFDDTILDDEAGTSITAGAAPFAGRFRPEQLLSSLDGTNPNGTWQLRVFDEVDGDGGSLNGWALVIDAGGEPSVVTGADGSYTFSNLQPGTYTVREVPQTGWSQTSPAGGAHSVVVTSGQAVTGRDFGNFQGVVNAAVVGRRVFYNNSAFDGSNPAAGAQDDAAIATDKVALLPLQSATPANVTSYSRGINGVMVDLTRVTAALAADDFEFRVGNGNSPALWALAPAPVSIVQRPSGLPDASTRVTIVWADNTIRNQWLEVTIKANADTRLAVPDVFYFGNLAGETVGSPGAAPFVVNGSDLLATRAARQPGPVAVTSPADHNRDGRVNILDEMIVRANDGRALTELIRPRSVSESGETLVAASDTRRTRAVPVTRSVLA
jgi:uncharacterized delta-60 repeat protein